MTVAVLRPAVAVLPIAAKPAEADALADEKPDAAMSLVALNPVPAMLTNAAEVAVCTSRLELACAIPNVVALLDWASATEVWLRTA